MSLSREDSMPTVVPLRRRPDLVPFFTRCFEDEWADWYGPGRRGDARSDLLEFANPAGALPVGVVALDDDSSPLGIAALKATSIDCYTHVGPWATAGYVLPARRREGIGALLLKSLIEEARRLEFGEIYCATASAVSLLEREGWTRIDAVSHDGGTQLIFRVVTARPDGTVVTREL
jgi:GNAT superfamily N-acetyltransferase